MDKTIDAREPGRTVIFVGNDMLGGGDPTLGQSLLRMYFYNLARRDAPPAALLFMNAGVKLPTLDEQAIEHLRALADKGVEILACGTCLDFYGPTDRLAVGSVSNMHDISETMLRADKVISL